MNMTPGGLDGTIGILMVTTENSLRVTGEDRNLLIHEVVVQGSSRITVRRLVDLLTSKGLTRYMMFNTEGMGYRWRSCRCWRTRAM